MKRVLLSFIVLVTALPCLAQQELAFPFQGGNKIMTQFFKDSIIVSPAIIKSRANGNVVFKFTADDKGIIKKLVIAYADDAVLAPPLIEALKKSSYKWVIPDHEKSHDFIITFAVGFTPPLTTTPVLQKALYNFYTKRKPIISVNQVPLDNATLLPTILVNYKIEE